MLGTGTWATKVRGRWLVYRTWADNTASEPIARQRYEESLAQIRALDENPGEMADDPARREAQRKWLAYWAEQHRRGMEQSATRRKVYEPAARRPWLPIPPNPPLDLSELEKPE